MLAMVEGFELQRVICRKSPFLTYTQLHLAPPLVVTPFEFFRDLRQQKTRLPGLSCGIVCVILHLAVSIQHQLVKLQPYSGIKMCILLLLSLLLY